MQGITEQETLVFNQLFETNKRFMESSQGEGIEYRDYKQFFSTEFFTYLNENRSNILALTRLMTFMSLFVNENLNCWLVEWGCDEVDKKCEEEGNEAPGNILNNLEEYLRLNPKFYKERLSRDNLIM